MRITSMISSKASMRSRAGAHAAGSGGGDAAADGEERVAQDPAGELNLIRSVLHMLSVRGPCPAKRAAMCR